MAARHVGARQTNISVDARARRVIIKLQISWRMTGQEQVMDYLSTGNLKSVF